MCVVFAENTNTANVIDGCARAIKAGHVDEFQRIVCPIIVGGGKRGLTTVAQEKQNIGIKIFS